MKGHPWSMPTESAMAEPSGAVSIPTSTTVNLALRISFSAISHMLRIPLSNKMELLLQ